MKATDYVAKFLHQKKVDSVFEMSGGMITHLLDSIHLLGKTRIVSTHHEQAAAFAAEGYGRMTGIPGVAMATSGPGATNLLTGIGSCYFDSTPAVFITGQVNRHEQKGDLAIRQLGFQETNIVEMARPITKAAKMIRDAAEIPFALEEAFRIAVEGRPGPVLLDIPMDIQRMPVDEKSVLSASEQQEINVGEYEKFSNSLMEAILVAKNPLVLAGGGVRSGRCVEEFKKFVDTLSIPVVHSLMAVDALAYMHPLRVGMIGTYGNRWANIALAKSDLVIVLGSRLDVRQTGSDTDMFRKGKKFFHVDCEVGEVNNRVKGCETLISDLRKFLVYFNSQNVSKSDWTSWCNEIMELRASWPDNGEITGTDTINPNTLMHELSAVGSAVSAYVADVGQHQMWAAQSLRLTSRQRFLTSGGMGSMGFALPAAIGVALAAPQSPCMVIAGDGGFQSNIQELETIRRYQLPIKMVIVNNQCHGMVRQFQESYFEGRYQSTFWGYSAPDFTKVAQAYGIESENCAAPELLTDATRWLMRDPMKPALLQVMIDTFANAYPKVAFGRPISDMEPFFKPIEMEST
ncbi:MAG: thiamine pyrophosphate-binding protein [Planctomycetota bacterium]|nr:thiamine pyrophosphate-binding protein [Planctomycetota bacterium]